jgi:dynein heavy chain
MKERICGRRNAPKQVLKPFFEVDVHLEGQKSILKPSLDDVQTAINRAASHVLKSTKQVQNWNQQHLPEDQREPFYDWIAKDKEIVKVILLLTGSIQGTKNKVTEFLDRFSVYKWLWNEKPEDSLKKFKLKEPQLEDFENKLSDFDAQAKAISNIEDSHQIGALLLKTSNVKKSLIRQIQNWKDVFSMELHKKAKNALDILCDEIKHIQTKIEKPAEDVDSLGGVMQALEEIRKKQSDFKMQLKPINEMYALLEQQNQES